MIDCCLCGKFRCDADELICDRCDDTLWEAYMKGEYAVEDTTSHNVSITFPYDGSFPF